MITDKERQWNELFIKIGELKGEVEAILDARKVQGPILLGDAARRADEAIREFWIEHKQELFSLDDALIDEVIDLVRVRYQTYGLSFARALREEYPPTATTVAALDHRLTQIDDELKHGKGDLDWIWTYLQQEQGVVGVASHWRETYELYLDHKNEAMWRELQR